MAKYTFDQVKRNVAEIANRDSYTKDFIFELMAAYGRAASAINQLRSGAINKAEDSDALLQKGVLYFKVFPQGTSLEEKVEEMDFEPLSGRYDPRYIIATDLHHIVAKDTVKHTTLDIEIKDIDNEVAFFYGWTGNEINEGSADESAADRRAADKMKDLYDEIERENIDAFQANPVQFRHDLNVFFSRLLFCFFAEDTGLFEPKQFTNSIKEFTETDGSDLDLFFSDLFKSLDSEDKSEMTTPYSEFPYVNGSLFDTEAHDIAIPKFSPTARHILILCADLDWSGVNPDIFGTIFQGIVDETRRDENGMDYTSVPNILKVIDPLFIDELRDEYDKAFDSEKKLYALWARISKIKVFDPACGSGNFLIISYKKLRELEHDIIRRISELMEKRGIKGGLEGYALASQIKLDHFFGVELEDFPRELAVLSMYIAAHQMNIEFEKEFGKKLSIIPLIDMPTIFRENSAKTNWNIICPNNGTDEIYVIGNPPYKGAKYQTTAQKDDKEYVLKHISGYKKLDYVSIWFDKAAAYIKNTNAKSAFVSTNSICQGEQAAILWEYIFSKQIEISFAFSSFRWTNNAKDQAGVTVVVIALRNKNNESKRLYIQDEMRQVSEINAYLIEAEEDMFVTPRKTPLSFSSIMSCGSRLDDNGGQLQMDSEEYNNFILKYPESKKLFKMIANADDVLKGKIGTKYALWLVGVDRSDYNYPEINNRINKIAEKRSDNPQLFSSIRCPETDYLFIPQVSSENRDYIPIAYLSKDIIPLDPHFFLDNINAAIFAILQSKMHMAWVKTICGKLKTDYRYSSTLGYNTFPCPTLTLQQKEKLEQSARSILFARANHPELTLADMYNPDKMPDDLRKAHEENDILVDKLYRATPFQTDEARLATLFKLYEEMTRNDR